LRRYSADQYSLQVEALSRELAAARSTAKEAKEAREAPGMVVIKSTHSTDVESPPPHPRVYLSFHAEGIRYVML
jgi:hypothetical protein